jgi:hypothetical protein
MRPVLCNAQFICMVSQLGMDKYRFKLHMKGLYSVPLEVELAHRIYITSLCNVTYCMLKHMLESTSKSQPRTTSEDQIITNCFKFLSSNCWHCTPDDFSKFILCVWIVLLCAVLQTSSIYVSNMP